MEKPTRIRHIAKVTKYIPGFTPLTETLNYLVYFILKVRFESFRQWQETEKISREEFEKDLHNNQELLDAYLDVFSNRAEFFLSKISYYDMEYHYCIMSVQKQIVMLYYRKILMIVD